MKGQAKFPDNPGLDVQRDIFVFQCFIGCRVGDLMKMTKANIINGAIEYVPDPDDIAGAFGNQVGNK